MLIFVANFVTWKTSLLVFVVTYSLQSLLHFLAFCVSLVEYPFLFVMHYLYIRIIYLLCSSIVTHIVEVDHFFSSPNLAVSKSDLAVLSGSPCFQTMENIYPSFLYSHLVSTTAQSLKSQYCNFILQ